MKNKLNIKDSITELLCNEIEVINDHTVNILNAACILNSHGIKHKVKHGWKVNSQKQYNIEAYLYIEMYLGTKHYFIDIIEDICVTRHLTKEVFRKLPSEKRINHILKTSC